MKRNSAEVAMKFRRFLVIPVILTGTLVAVAAPGPATDSKEKKDSQQVERTVSVDASVVVSVCVTSGDITVRGWDKNEVRARSHDAAQIELRSAGVKPQSGPAKKIEVLVSDKPEMPRVATSCQGFSDIELTVPRGATIQVQSRDGDIDVAEIAAAYVNTQNGDVTISRVTRSVDVGSIGGAISLKNSSGRITLHSIGGLIEANDVKPVDAGDVFDASSVSGDLVLNRIAHLQLNAHTVNASVSLTGPLVKGGRYGFRTYSGDITLTLPGDASFKLNAKISKRGDIITDFPLTMTTEPGSSPPEPPSNPPPANPPQGDGPMKGNKGMHVPQVVVTIPPYTLQHINAIHGAGDAMIYVASFSGTIHLRKQ
jgi:hypothetical protein